jgi:hypothetical protein
MPSKREFLQDYIVNSIYQTANTISIGFDFFIKLLQSILHARLKLSSVWVLLNLSEAV